MLKTRLPVIEEIKTEIKKQGLSIRKTAFLLDIPCITFYMQLWRSQLTQEICRRLARLFNKEEDYYYNAFNKQKFFDKKGEK